MKNHGMEYNTKNNFNAIYNILKERNIIAHENLESYMHALIDIEESFINIYKIYLDEIIKNEENTDFIKEKIWDIREEFRHIQYHINDAKLTE